MLKALKYVLDGNRPGAQEELEERGNGSQQGRGGARHEPYGESGNGRGGLARRSDITAETKISVKNINHYFKSSKGIPTHALKGISLDIVDHEFVAIVGPSGCGKSTLLNIMSGLFKATEGNVYLDGQLLRGVTPKIGYMSQADALMPWRTLTENVELGLEIKGISRAERREIAKDLIERTGLKGFENSYPHELSGGMRKGSR